MLLTVTSDSVAPTADTDKDACQVNKDSCTVGFVDIHAFLASELRRRDWNVSRLADACDTGISLVARWVTDDPKRRVRPSPASCQRIAKALNVDVDYVLALAGHREDMPRTTERREVDPVQAELDQRLERLSQLLSPYPRSYWSTLIDVFERMATLPEATRAVSTPADQAVSRPVPTTNGPNHADGGQIKAYPLAFA